ncbi:MAG TPA: alpha/beta hydrolase, partial [Ruminococcus flavefaciens]|nr:alpha/beta hydrolase [Ruminococcus flavefaciens]
MKKTFKLTGKILLALLMLIIVFLLVMFISNKIMMNSERELLKTYPGELVEVDGHNMNVYTKGEGEHTLVFLSGSGTAAPVLD